MRGTSYSLGRKKIAAILLASLLLLPHHAAADNKGLFISPLREYITVDAGKTATKSITVANLTDKNITVTLSVEEFSVADFTYQYEFKPPKDTWVRLGLTEIKLQPGKSHQIPYQITIPPNAAPGGHYFTIFATTNFGGTNQVQATTVLYLTVNGVLRKTSVIRSSTMPWLSLGNDIPFTLTAQNTGNTHFFAYVSGRLTGWGSKKSGEETTRLLLPGASRNMGNTIPAPLLPGVYKATYGYRTDAGQTIQRSRYIFYLPLWSLALPLGLIWLMIVFIKSARRRAKA
jgi:hypothetical protein